jgi:hypothetical protein
LYAPKLSRLQVKEMIAPALIEREQMLITELLGERVKIRAYGYKTMRVARVEAREIVRFEYKPGGMDTIKTGKFEPHFNYEGEARAGRVDQIMRLDVETFDGWATVWDEGVQDLNPWDRLKPAGSAKPTKKQYKAGSETL